MPNINLLTAINTATSSTYVVVSDKGFARRVSFDNLTHAVELGFSGPSRTNQYLYTTSSVIFNVTSIVANSTSTYQSGNYITPFGFSSAFSHFDGTAIQNNDILGALRFGGFDGTRMRTGLFNIGAAANENWSVDANNTATHAGVNWSVSCQPAGIQLTTSSVMKMIVGGSIVPTITGVAPPTMFLHFGSGADGLTPQIISSDGSTTYKGHGRTDLKFFHSCVTQVGVTTSGPADNSTINGTNIYSFFTSRQNAADISNRQHLQNQDSIGIIDFVGAVEDGSNLTAPTSAQIRVSAVEEFSTTTNGSSITFLTAPQSTGTGISVISTTTMSTRLLLSNRSNNYLSDKHVFLDANSFPIMQADTNNVSMLGGVFSFQRSTGITFPDGSTQASAFKAVPLPPTSSNSTGTVGQFAYDMGYVYMCVAANTWRRFAASTF
jgi:hypothetical protein